jgi:hypothetical protein
MWDDVGTLNQPSADSSESTNVEAAIDEMSVAMAVGVVKVAAEEWRARL